MSNNANVNTRHPETGCTALMAAAAKGQQELVEQLLKLAADKFALRLNHADSDIGICVLGMTGQQSNLPNILSIRL